MYFITKGKKRERKLEKESLNVYVYENQRK